MWYGVSWHVVYWSLSSLVSLFGWSLDGHDSYHTHCHVTRGGVPQGSVLSPLLFILYINDLEEYLMDSRIGLSAHDTTLYFSGDSIADVMLTLQNEMCIVGEWLSANKLSLNAEKLDVWS